MVRTLRILVPASGVVAVLVVLAAWWFSTARIPDFGVTDVTITEDGIAMNAPILRGEDQDGRPYVLRATEAFQSLSDNPTITMRNLDGEITLDDEEQAFLIAPQARYQSDLDLITFDEGGLEIRLTSGGQAFLGVTQVNLENGTLNSDQPVRIANAEVTLNAGAVQGFDGGERLLFTQGVRMVVTPAQNGPQDGVQ